MKSIKKSFILKRSPSITSIVVILVVVVAGVHLLVGSHAESPYETNLADAGTLTVPATVQSCSGSSDGNCVQFGRSPLTTVLQGLNLINYYPSNYAWTNMWTDYKTTGSTENTAINSDFATMHSMGANAVRIIIQAYTFGYPTPLTSEQAELAQVISMAQANGLKVQLTLFDFFNSNADYQDFTGSDTWANDVLTPYKNDPEIVFVEIQNEINPTNSLAMTWLQHMIPVVKAAAGDIPITASVTNTANTSTATINGVAPGSEMNVAQSLSLFIPQLSSTPLDFYDVHYYSLGPLAYSILSSVRAEAGTKPTYVGETGSSSYVTGCEPPNNCTNTITEGRQDMYLRQVETATQELGLGSAGAWIFQDLASGQVNGDQTVGTYSDQNFFGLLRLNGSLKPAANSIETIYKTGVVSTDINGDFSDYDSTDNGVVDWSTQDASYGNLSWDGTTGHDAPGSVELSDTSSVPDGSSPNFQSVPIANLTASGQKVTVSAWAKTSSATGTNDIEIDWFDDNGSYISSVHSSSLDGNNNWTQLKDSAMAPNNATFFQISLHSVNNTGSVWYDDVSSTVQ